MGSFCKELGFDTRPCRRLPLLVHLWGHAGLGDAADLRHVGREQAHEQEGGEQHDKNKQQQITMKHMKQAANYNNTQQSK